MGDVAKPLPRRDGLNGEFYEYCARGELRFQRCSECGAWRHMPRYHCAKCGSERWSWERSSGKGTLYSWTVCHRAFHPGFADDVPYVVAIVELEEGPRIATQIVDRTPDELRLSMPVEVVFEPMVPGVVLPKFRAAASR
ncbi:MAG: Zn-ribbon domain-containing OB-fold protein [Alphaproteobacteria bacterium]